MKKIIRRSGGRPWIAYILYRSDKVRIEYVPLIYSFKILYGLNKLSGIFSLDRYKTFWQINLIGLCIAVKYKTI